MSFRAPTKPQDPNACALCAKGPGEWLHFKARMLCGDCANAFQVWPDWNPAGDAGEEFERWFKMGKRVAA